MRTRSLFLVASLAAASSAFSQMTVFSDGFEGETGTGLNYTNFANWDVTDGTVDLLGSGGNPGRWVDLDGSSSNSGAFSTKSTFDFDAGVLYTIQFDYMSTGSANSVAVSLGGVSYLVPTSSGTWQTFTGTFALASSTNTGILFQDQGNDNVGVGIDNVHLTSAVPEPATFAALGAGTLVLLRRRRRS